MKMKMTYGKGFEMFKIELSRVGVIRGKEFRERLYLVKVDGHEIGTIGKVNNTRTETHPWKAWFFTGRTADENQPEGFTYDREFLGSWYHSDAAEGGRIGALEAVIERHLYADLPLLQNRVN